MQLSPVSLKRDAIAIGSQASTLFGSATDLKR